MQMFKQLSALQSRLLGSVPYVPSTMCRYVKRCVNISTNMNISCSQFLLLILVFPKGTSGVDFLFGDCPVHLNEPCRPDIVKFILSTKYENRTFIHNLDPFKLYLPKKLNILIPLKVLVHGYGGLGVDSSTRNVSKAYEDLGYNVILVDWQPLSTIPCYTTAYINTWHVGQCLGILAVSLMKLGISPLTIHVIGFSLGAHIAGFAGAHLNKILGKSFYRITGLDPALPFFATLKKDWKLDSGDALFVDVVHTSAGSFGKIEATGHVDFYVNGGSIQPFCYKAQHLPICSHLMAGIYFSESVTSKADFVGVACENIATFILGKCNYKKTAVMGERTSVSTRGIYFVETSSSPPFIGV